MGVAPLNPPNIPRAGGSLGPEDLPPPAGWEGGAGSALRLNRHWTGRAGARVRRPTARHGVGHPEVQGPGTSRRDTIQLVHVKDRGGPETVRSLPVNVGRQLDVIVEPEGLQWDGIDFEVVQHGGDTVEPQVLDVATTVVYSHTKMLQKIIRGILM